VLVVWSLSGYVFDIDDAVENVRKAFLGGGDDLVVCVRASRQLLNAARHRRRYMPRYESPRRPGKT
jgi:hypothetical protein